jgi:hypothetical protein
MKIWGMRFECLINKATNTHWECVIFIDFPLQQMFRLCALTSRDMYTSCLPRNIHLIKFAMECFLIIRPIPRRGAG